MAKSSRRENAGDMHTALTNEHTYTHTRIKQAAACPGTHFAIASFDLYGEKEKTVRRGSSHEIKDHIHETRLDLLKENQPVGQVQVFAVKFRWTEAPVD